MRLIATAAICLTLAACNRPPPPAAVTAPVPIDGTYGGFRQLSRGQAIDCGNLDTISIQVKSHAFTYRLSQPQADWRPVIVFSATIAADGTFNAQSGPDSMSGHVANGSMQGQIIGDVCGFTFSAAHGGI